MWRKNASAPGLLLFPFHIWFETDFCISEHTYMHACMVRSHYSCMRLTSVHVSLWLSIFLRYGKKMILCMQSFICWFYPEMDNVPSFYNNGHYISYLIPSVTSSSSSSWNILKVERERKRDWVSLLKHTIAAPLSNIFTLQPSPPVIASNILLFPVTTHCNMFSYSR